jgi:hypothetical protein
MKARSLFCMVVPVVVGVAFAAGPTVAGASTTSAFQAAVKSVSPPGNPGTCRHTWCGTANIAGYGAATWTFDVPPGGVGNYGDPTPQCATYTATGAFVLKNSPGTLTYSETGTVCAPGNSAIAPRQNPFGAPWTDITGSWTVTGGTGDFAGVVPGVPGLSPPNGSDSAKLTGPELRGTYTGTLTTS